MPDKYLVALYSFETFGPARTKLLIDYFGSSEKAWNATLKQYLEIGLKEPVAKKFIAYRDSFDIENFFKNLEKHNIKTVTIDDVDYPENLKGLDDAPLVLYVRGSLSKNDVNSVAIVGSRKMTSYGSEATEKFSQELANIGVTIVSGLAFGVDLAAHKAAVEIGGRCIAVLASGIDNITPRSNEWLGLKIIENGGAVISEYPPGVAAQKYYFPYRNRIISGLSKAVLVIEGMIHSGTVHTANHAASQGRTVFAVPGSIFSPMSQAPYYLIKNGAKIATAISDILEELDMQLKVDKEAMAKTLPSDEFEERILEILANEELHIDEIGRITGLQVSSVSAKLTVMQLKGLVKSVGAGVYKKL